jgi:ABC-2 type transport system ATP-binding protein
VPPPPPLTGESVKVVHGRAAGTEIQIEQELLFGRAVPGPGGFGHDPELSRVHARIFRAGDGRLLLDDLGSTNGTYLNGWRIPAPQVLSPGDRLQVGATVLEVHAPEGPQVTMVRRRPVVLDQAISRSPAAEPEPTPTAVLLARGVEKAYGERKILKGVDLEIEAGEVVGLLGPNGAGKTTFVSIVAGLRQADAGSVQVAGIDALRNSSDARKHLGIAPQDLGIYPTMSVRRNLTYFGEIAGLRGRELSARVDEVAESLSLTPMLERRAGTLSGGQQRRLHTGMALLHHPALCILDEPTVGADIRTRQEILDLVKRLAGEGRAVCYSTHYLPEIEELGASVAILDGGRVIARGSIAELVAKHSETAVELHFHGEPPSLSIAGQVTREDSVLRIATPDPSQVAAHAVGQLGAEAQRLRAVEIIRPSLDSVYLALTQRRYEPGVDEQQPLQAHSGSHVPPPGVPVAARR